MKKILVVGSFMTDLVISSDRFVLEGETIVGNSFEQYPGGKGANQAVAAAKLGGDVTMIGKLGNDLYGQEQIQAMIENNINYENILFSKTSRTGIGNPQLDKFGHNRIVIIPGANIEFRPEEIAKLAPVIQEHDIVVLQLEIPLETVYETIRLAEKFQKTIILNPAPAKKIGSEIAHKVDWLIPNEYEAEFLTGIKLDSTENIECSGQNLLNQGYKNIIITLGDRGLYFCNNKEDFFLDAFSVKPVDTTAAGDSFIGCFAYGLSQGLDIKNSLVLATADSALTVTRLGAQPSLPNMDEVNSFLSKKFSGKVLKTI